MVTIQAWVFVYSSTRIALDAGRDGVDEMVDCTIDVVVLFE